MQIAHTSFKRLQANTDEKLLKKKTKNIRYKITRIFGINVARQHVQY